MVPTEQAAGRSPHPRVVIRLETPCADPTLEMEIKMLARGAVAGVEAPQRQQTLPAGSAALPISLRTVA